MGQVLLLDYISKNEEIIKAKVKQSLPKHMDMKKVWRAFGSELERNKQLKLCAPKSVISSLIRASQFGLEVSSILGHAYLIPFDKSVNIGTKVKPQWIKEKQCEFILGYRGMIVLARRTGNIPIIYSQAVHENDHFVVQWGTDEKLEHKPAKEDRGELVAAYAIAKFSNTFTQDGLMSSQFDVMQKEDIDKIKARSRSGNNGPWVTDYPEMAKKTVLRRLFKYLPISIEIQEKIIEEEQRDLGVADYSMDFSEDEIPGEAEPANQAEEIAQKLKSKKEELPKKEEAEDVFGKS